MDAAGLVGQARTLKVHPSLEALVLRGYLYRGKNLGTPKAPVAVLKNWAFATPRESHRGIHDVRFLQKKMGVNRGTHVPGPIYKLPSQAIRRRSGMAPRTANAARCGYGGMWGEVGGDFVLWSLAPPGVRAATHGTRRRRERQLTNEIDLEDKRPGGESGKENVTRKLITPLGLPDLTRLEVGGGKGLTHLDLWLDLPETQLREAQPPRREPPGPG